jgi:hypothetical protein
MGWSVTLREILHLRMREGTNWRAFSAPSHYKAPFADMVRECKWLNRRVVSRQSGLEEENEGKATAHFDYKGKR